MKVLMISKAFVNAAYHTKLVELSKLGVELLLVLPKHWNNQLPEITVSPFYSIRVLPITFSGRNHFHFYVGAKKIIQEFKPDIIHIDEEHYSIVTYQWMRLAHLFNTPALFYTWQNIFKLYPFPFSLIEQYNFSHAMVGMCGNAESALVLKQKGFNREMPVIPQVGVDPEVFRSFDKQSMTEKFKLVPAIFRVGFFGRLVEEKGIIEVIKSIPKINQDVSFLFVGNGSLKLKIEKLAKTLKIENRIQIISFISSTEMPGIINTCDLTILPSLTKPNWKEQFGRILIESMACEVPVLGSSSGEIPLVIGKIGYIFPEDNFDIFCEIINHLSKNPTELCEKGKQSREHILKYYTQKIIAKKTTMVYQRMLNK